MLPSLLLVSLAAEADLPTPGPMAGHQPGEEAAVLAVVDQVDGKTTHCGVDTFDFVKVGGRWRVANMMWTVEPDACAGLRPAGAVMRPHDGRW